MSGAAVIMRVVGALATSEGENGKAGLVALCAAGFATFLLVTVGPIIIVVAAVGGWQYEVGQYTQTTSSAYLDGQQGTNYGDILLDGWVTYYNQTDLRWGQEGYGLTSTISRAGCGPTSMAIVVSTLLEEEHDPLELSDWAYENGYCCEGYGSYHSLIPAVGDEYGLETTLLGIDTDAVIAFLESGGLVVAIMGEGHFTSSGHFIVLRGVTEDGDILVADPANYQRTLMEWDADVIWGEAKAGASAGGPFWGFSS